MIIEPILPLYGTLLKVFNCFVTSFLVDSMSTTKKCFGTIPTSRKLRSIDCDNAGHHPLPKKQLKNINYLKTTIEFLQQFTGLTHIIELSD